MRKITRHLSYANVMSTLAVFLLLGGATALAAKKQTQKIGSTQLKASAVTTNKIKNGAVANSKLAAAAVSSDKLADGSVINSKLADGAVGGSKIAGDAVTGDKVNESTLSEVPSANSANPSAFARVNANGVVDAANSKGITSPNVSKPGTGIYCISVPAFTPRGGQVSTQTGGTASSAQIGVPGTGASCGGAVQVSTFNQIGTATDLTFYVELYR
jgi:hypothetical protein